MKNKSEKEYQKNSKVTSMHQLIEFEKSDWLKIIKKSGVPDFIDGKSDEEKIEKYADMLTRLCSATFPTQRITRMVAKNQLGIEITKISKELGTFLSKNKHFDFASSCIHDFEKEIKEVASKNYDEVKSELKKIQRVFQVSPSSEAMTVLMENNLHSAHTIASIPRKIFTKKYSNVLGGEHVAMAIHQRASHINTRAEMNAMHLTCPKKDTTH